MNVLGACIFTTKQWDSMIASKMQEGLLGRKFPNNSTGELKVHPSRHVEILTQVRAMCIHKCGYVRHVIGCCTYGLLVD